MVTYKEVAGINGAEFIAKGLERGFEQIDVVTERAAKAPHLRPSTWINIGWGLGVQLMTLWRKPRAPWDLILISEGAHHLTKVVDYVEEYAAPAAAVVRVQYRPTGAGGGAGNQRIHTREIAPQVGVPASYDVNPYKP